MQNIIREKLTKALDPQVLEIVDESLKHAGHAGARPGGNTHFHIKAVSKVFEPLSRLERHRKVHELLKGELNTQIHALSLDLRSPQEP
ncbi:MAG: bolA-like family protein [Alphaproteobacteria bacterium]|jgi:BolA protein|nr:bolA-like family protein [Alphaproteobacteria bacterium]